MFLFFFLRGLGCRVWGFGFRAFPGFRCLAVKVGGVPRSYNGCVI